mgnify:CR=1 FL=1
MNRLDVNYINIFSDYTVWAEGENLYFVTDYDIKYLVCFDKEETPRFDAYWFSLANMNQKESPRDAKVAQTVLCIIEEFFRTNPDIMLYMCSTVGNQQAQRARLFSFWFKKQVSKSAITLKLQKSRARNLGLKNTLLSSSPAIIRRPKRLSPTLTKRRLCSTF